jgi:hypothetical protein
VRAFHLLRRPQRLHVADDPDDAVKIITDFKQKQGPGGLAMPSGMKKDQDFDSPEPTQATA